MRKADAVRWLVALSGVAAGAENALAGAWSQPSGEGQSITTLSHEVADARTTWRLDDLIEYGFAEGWEWTFKAETSFVEAEIYENRFDANLGLKRSFAVGERAAVALQGAVISGETLTGDVCKGTGYEVRASTGTSFNLWGMEGFVNVERALRDRGDECQRRLIEAAVGLDLTEHWRGIGKVWSEDGDGAKTAKAEVQVFRTMGDATYGLGYREEISGRFEERGVVLTRWSRF